MVGACACAALVAALAAVPARGSIMVGIDARTAALHVDSGGFAQVDWVKASGEHASLLISPTGSLTFGGRLPGSDVSAPAPGVHIPYALAVRKTPDGRLWSL